MVKKQEYIQALFDSTTGLPLEMCEKIVYFMYTYEFKNSFDFNKAVQNYPNNIDTYGVISYWDVSNVTNMYAAFYNKDIIEDISKWDVSNVINMNYLFCKSDYKGDISNWDVSSVIEMAYMFDNTTRFNQDISNWDVSNVTNMSSMFVNAFSFNFFLGHWDVSNVTNMNNMFAFATSFNQELEEYWDVNKVTDCGGFSYQSKMKTKPKFTKCNPN